VSASHRRPAWRPLGLALLALAYLLGTFAEATHWLTTAHRLCEVHGTLEHVADAEELGASGAVAQASPTPEGPVLVPEPGAHDTCEVSDLAAPTPVPLDLDVPPSIPPTRVAAVAPPPSVPLPSGPRHGLAPSRSPPAV
jgi:hypothetical protein